MRKTIDITSRIERYKRFFLTQHPGGILVTASFTGGEETGGIDFRNFDFSRESEHRRYWDILVEKQTDSIGQHEGIEDDWIPGIVLHYGFGAFGGVYCDGDIKFTADTSYLEPVMNDWDRLNTTLYSKDRFWSHIFAEAAGYLSEKGQQFLFMVDVFPNPSPLDVANLLRGNEIFTDIFEYTAELKRLLDCTTLAVIENAKRIRQALKNPWGGTFAFNHWMPGGILLLEDAADLCSPGNYKEFGMPYTRKVIVEMGGAYIHHHSLGRHQYGNIASLPGLYVQQISSDPNCKRPMDDLGCILGETGNTVVEIECTAQEVYRNIEDIRRGRFILTVDCTDKEEARELVGFVRENSSL